ncbi:MAG: site-specific integrase [Desulfuromonadaceae bacterium]|nr:site-specific integrase [Desulfuromonadaceae bacterium]
MANIQKVEGKRGAKFRALVRIKGFPPQSATFDRITDAKKWVQDTESAIRERRYFKTAEAQHHTVEDMIKKYVKDVLPQKKTTKDVSLHLNYWKEQIGAYMLSDVTPAMLGEVKERLLSEPIIKTRKVSRKAGCAVIETKSQRNGATVNRYMASMSHCLSVAANEWQWLEVNPMQKVKKLKESRGRVRFLDDDERERLLKACQESVNPFLYTVVVLAASTGMRHGEIMNLSWSDIDFSNRRIILEETKNGERRAVALVGKALELLQELKKQKVRRIDNNLVFPGSHVRNKGHASLRPAFLAALKKAKIENFKFHDLRHSAASYLAMNGASLTDIAAVLGHKTLAMVKRYSHLSDSHVSSVVESMNKKIFG